MESRVNKGFVTALIGLVVVIVLFVVFNRQTASKISADQAEIKTLEARVVSLNTQATQMAGTLSTLQDAVNTATSTISTLKDEITSSGTTVSALQQQATSDASQVTALQQQVASISSQVTTIEGDSTSDDTKVTSLASQITTLSSKLSSLSSSLTNLQSTVSSLSTRVSELGSSSTVTLFTDDEISQSPDTLTLLDSFTASYAGYLYISGTSSSSTGYIKITNVTEGTSTTYSFSTSNSLEITIDSGTVRIYFGNTESTDTVTAALSATYTY